MDSNQRYLLPYCSRTQSQTPIPVPAVNAVMISSCCLIRGDLRVELLGSGKCPIVFKLARITVGRDREETRPRRDPLLAGPRMFRGLLRVGVSFGPEDLRRPSRRPFRCSPQHPVHNIPSSDRRRAGCRADALASCRLRSACCSFPRQGTHGSHQLTCRLRWAGVGLFRPRARSSFSTNPAVFDSRIT
jgi:hypothetical protein